MFDLEVTSGIIYDPSAMPDANKLNSMTKKIIAAFFFISLLAAVQAQEKTLVKNMKISRSMKIKKAVYALDAFNDLAKPALIIEGDNIVIDFKYSLNNCL